ncbi:MAG: hypothetical protein OXU22_01220 [Gammaproteobacteria bacterium]|nr:hypothetical protein [Gammaproteobacteria bacterium]
MGRRFRARIRGLLGGAALLACAPAAVTAFNLHEQVLPRAQWPQHANGRNVAALPAVAEALRRFEENGKIVIVIRYLAGRPGRAGPLPGVATRRGRRRPPDCQHHRARLRLGARRGLSKTVGREMRGCRPQPALAGAMFAAEAKH